MRRSSLVTSTGKANALSPFNSSLTIASNTSFRLANNETIPPLLCIYNAVSFPIPCDAPFYFIFLISYYNFGLNLLFKSIVLIYYFNLIFNFNILI